MKEFVSHIDYLIQKHDCVIIPDFGGFVLSHEGASFGKDGAVLPPKITVGFNAQLKSNDGLLAESYMNMYSVPYDEACKRIDESVKRLNTILSMKHPVQMGRLGKLALDKEGQMTFIPNENLSIFHPDTFGLSAVNMRRLSVIEKEKLQKKRRIQLKRTFAATGAAAAAILLFFLASTPISEKETIQKSSFFTDLVSNTVSSNSSKPSSTEVGNDASYSNEISEESNEVDVEINHSEAPSITEPGIKKSEVVVEESSKLVDSRPVKTPRNNYFIIIGGAANEAEGKLLLSRFKSQGYANADIVTSKTRARIYVASFATHEEADKYLVQFKKENPKLSDAWVYYRN